MRARRVVEDEVEWCEERGFDKERGEGVERDGGEGRWRGR